ncbi:MAG: sulfite exporter TauE/SafE family protein [Planctomycetota bacterium]
MLAWSLLSPDVTQAGLVQFLVIGSLAALLFSMAKSGFGGGVGMLASPMMVIATGDATIGMGIMLPMLIVADYVAVVTWWKHWNLRAVGMLLPGVIAGILLAWGALTWLKSRDLAGEQEAADAAMKIAIGVIAIVFVALHVIRTLRGAQLTFRPVWWQAGLAGTSAGVTSTFAHAAGPIAAMYLLPQQMLKHRYVATTAALFWTVNQLKLIPYAQLGMINTGTLGAGVVLLPAIAVGAVAGRFLHSRVNTKQFLGVVYTLLLIAGVHLLVKGLGEFGLTF